MRAVVIGEEHFVRFWELFGFEGHVVNTEAELFREVKRLIEDEAIGLILVPEKHCEKLREIKERLLREGRITPVFAFMPDSAKPEDIRINVLKKLISFAVGVELRL